MKRVGLIFSLWAVLAIRAHEILRLPAFVDESLHIMRAQIVFDFSDAVSSILPGKLLTYYYLGAFFPENHTALWLGRVAIALLAPLGAALCYALAYRFSRSYWLSLGVLWLYTLNPLMIFFGRMALADPLALVLSLGFIWALLRAEKQAWAAGSGLLLGAALLAKLTALPLLILPVVLYLVGRKSWAGANRGLGFSFRQMVLVYMLAGLCLLPSLMYSVYQEVGGVDQKAEIVSTSLIQSEDRSRPEQIAHNLSTYGEALLAFSPLCVIFLLIPLVLPSRAGLGLMAILALCWGFIIFSSSFPTTRYLAATYPLAIIATGISLAGRPRIGRPLMGGLVALSLAQALFFIPPLWEDPAGLALGSQDEWEYFSHTSSGYGLPEIADRLLFYAEVRDPLPVLSLMGNCHSLRFYLPEGHPIKLNCRDFPFHGNPILLEEAEWARYVDAQGQYLLLIETPSNAGRLDSLYPRPEGKYEEQEATRLYIVTP